MVIATHATETAAAASSFPFQYVVITFPDEKAARSADRGPLDQLRLSYPSAHIVATCDPHHCRVGSGGGTLNALEHVLFFDEHRLSEKTDQDESPSILILHAGGASSRCPSQMILGKAWSSIPTEASTKAVDSQQYGEIQNPLLLWLRCLEQLFRNVLLPRGSLVVVSSDTILDVSTTPDNIKIKSPQHRHDLTTIPSTSVVALSVPASLSVAGNHGVFVPREQNTIAPSLSPCDKVFQKPSMSVMKEHCAFFINETNNEQLSPRAWIDTGLICFLPDAAQALKRLVEEEETCRLTRCTQRGLELCFQQEIQLQQELHKNQPSCSVFYQSSACSIDLYTHFLNALQPGELSLTMYCEKFNEELPRNVAAALYASLSSSKLFVWTVPTGSFLHLGTTRELMNFLIAGTRRERAEDPEDLPSQVASGLKLLPRVNAVLLNEDKQDNKNSSPKNVIYDSFLSAGTQHELSIGRGVVLEHSFLLEPYGSIIIGDDCLISGLRSPLKDKESVYKGILIPHTTMVQELSIAGNHAFMVLGIDDEIKTSPCTNMYGQHVQDFLSWAELDETDLWPTKEVEQNLWNAKIHPICEHDDSFMSLFSWLNAFSQGDEELKNDESLSNWRRRQRVSLADIRQSAHAPTEFGYRSRLFSFLRQSGLSNANEECAFLANAFQEKENRLSHFHRVLAGRKHEQLNMLPWLADGGRNGDFSTCLALFRIIDDIIVDSFEAEQFDVCGRAWMLLQFMLEDLSCLDYVESSGFSDESYHVLLQNLSVESVTSSQRIVLNSHDMETQLKVFVGQVIDTFSSTGDGMKHVVDKFSSFRDLTLAADPKLFSPYLTNLCGKMAQEMTRLCVVGRNYCLENQKRGDLVFDQWILASAPARIDLAGGWTDTPPICFEHGSQVTGIAVSVDGKKPLSCRSRLLKGTNVILLVSEHRNMNGELLSKQEVPLLTLDEMKDYNDPSSPCALLKCALVILGLVRGNNIRRSSDSEKISLGTIVSSFCNSDIPVGLTVIVSSLLPHGSGMGSSSILAGCVLSSIGKCLGIELSTSDVKLSLIQQVLALEQELTTGGGFQDQMNGLFPSAKIVSCEALTFPLKLSVEQIPLEQSFKRLLDENLVLVFTGKTRLAKNILQTCLRRWATRSSDIVRNVDGLVMNALVAKDALLSGSLSDLGSVLNKYWDQKKIMAGEGSGVEPDIVAQLLENLIKSGSIYGGSLCGAGGGGFLVLVKSEKVELSDIVSRISMLDDKHKLTVHKCTIDDDGIHITNLSDDVMEASFPNSIH